MSEKPQLTKLFRDDPATPEGKYLVKRRDGTVVEWPNFVLGAKDPHSPNGLRAYAISIGHDPDCHVDYKQRLLKLASDFDEYRQEHGDGDPTRGRHRQDDPTTIAEMRGETPPFFTELLADLEKIACLGAGGECRGNSNGNLMAIAVIDKLNAHLNRLAPQANKSS